MALVSLNIISFSNVSAVIDYVSSGIDTGEDNKQQVFSLSFRVHVMYSPCSELSFIRKHVKWQLRLSDS